MVRNKFNNQPTGCYLKIVYEVKPKLDKITHKKAEYYNLQLKL